MKVQCEIDIDENKFVKVCATEDIGKLADAVNALHGRLWCEACYDPYNEQTEKMARELLPHVEAIKAILRIKK